MDYDFKTGGLTYAPPFHRPYDWEKSGDRGSQRHGDADGLAEIRTYADGIGPWKPYIVPVKGRLDDAGNLKDINGDGKIDLRDAVTGNPTSLIDDAQQAGAVRPRFISGTSADICATATWRPSRRVLAVLPAWGGWCISEFPATPGIAAR